MRRCLKILGWMGIGLSALLFIATVVLWVRSLGHQERWHFAYFEPRPDFRTWNLAGYERSWYAEPIHGRLWLESGTQALGKESKSRNQHWRIPISADQAKQRFESVFHPGERPWGDGTERAWRFAGAGFCQRRIAVDPRIGRYEAFELAIPFWMLAILFGFWPTLFTARRLLKHKRFAPGLCPHCGYDLRATPDRCPECGTEVQRTGRAEYRPPLRRKA